MMGGCCWAVTGELFEICRKKIKSTFVKWEGKWKEAWADRDHFRGPCDENVVWPLRCVYYCLCALHCASLPHFECASLQFTILRSLNALIYKNKHLDAGPKSKFEVEASPGSFTEVMKEATQNDWSLRLRDLNEIYSRVRDATVF